MKSSIRRFRHSIIPDGRKSLRCRRRNVEWKNYVDIEDYLHIKKIIYLNRFQKQLRVYHWESARNSQFPYLCMTKLY